MAVCDQVAWRRRPLCSRLVTHVAEDTRQWIGLDLEPSDALVVSPPTQLTARVAAVGLRHRDGKLIEGELPATVSERLRVSDARQHGRGVRHARIERCLGLDDETAGALLPAACVETAVDHTQARGQADAQRWPWRRRSRAPRSQPRSRTRA